MIGFGVAGLTLPVNGSYFGPALTGFAWLENEDYALGIHLLAGDAETGDEYSLPTILL